MPLYEYRCLSCHERFEVMQRVNDQPLAVCRDCGGRLEKLFSAPALQFKGTGWYVTDYAAGAKAKAESAASEKTRSEKPAQVATPPASGSASTPSEK